MLICKVAFVFWYLTIIATKIQCQLINPVRFDPKTYMRFPKESKVTLGSGRSTPDDFPIIQWTEWYDPYLALKCTAYTRDRKNCNFTLHMSNGTDEVEIQQVYQFTDEMLGIVWIESGIKYSKMFDYNVKIATIDMNTCQSTIRLEFDKMVTVEVNNDDDFDVYSTTEYDGIKSITHTCYSAFGYRLDVRTELLSNKSFRAFRASTESSSNRFYIYTFETDDSTLSLVDSNGKEIEHIADIGRQNKSTVISHSDFKGQAICWINENESKFCECMYEVGNDWWRNRTDCNEVISLFEVRILMGQGVLLLAIAKDEHFEIIEMRAWDETLKTRDTYVEWPVKYAKAMDLDELERTFVIYYSDTSSEHTDVKLIKYYLPSATPYGIAHSYFLKYNK